MSSFDAASVHWHAVCRAKDLKRKPRAIRLLGRDVVVFRTASGRIQAVADSCPHRLMRLSTGWVDGEELVCPYHAARINGQGQARKPATSNWRACVPHYDAIEQDGLVFVRDPGSQSGALPTAPEGHILAAASQHHIPSPLAVVLDNFAELEHAATTHITLGTAVNDLSEMTQELELSPDEVQFRISERQRGYRWLRPMERLFPVRTGDLHTTHATFRFAPLSAQYHHRWYAPDGSQRSFELRWTAYFTPNDDSNTSVFLCAWLPREQARLRRLVEFFNTTIATYEVYRDRKMMAGVSDAHAGLEKMKLALFDRPLVEIRKRLTQVYANAERGDIVPLTRPSRRSSANG